MGSEMCIRDRRRTPRARVSGTPLPGRVARWNFLLVRGVVGMWSGRAAGGRNEQERLAPRSGSVIHSISQWRRSYRRGFACQTCRGTNRRHSINSFSTVDQVTGIRAYTKIDAGPWPTAMLTTCRRLNVPVTSPATLDAAATRTTRTGFGRRTVRGQRQRVARSDRRSTEQLVERLGLAFGAGRHRRGANQQLELNLAKPATILKNRHRQLSRKSCGMGSRSAAAMAES